MRRLFTVRWRGEWRTYRGFEGLVLGEGLTPDLYPTVGIGDRIDLRRPDGKTIHTRIDRFHFHMPGIQIGLSRLIFLHEVPRGTEVWALEPDDSDHVQ